MKTIKARCPYCNEPTVEYVIEVSVPAVLHVYTNEDGSVDDWELDTELSIDNLDWESYAEGIEYRCASCGAEICEDYFFKETITYFLKEAEND